MFSFSFLRLFISIVRGLPKVVIDYFKAWISASIATCMLALGLVSPGFSS